MTTVRDRAPVWAPIEDARPEPLPAGAAAFSTTARTILPHAEGEGADLHLVGRKQARYEPVRPLGAGGMGEVELVLDRDIGRLVAVKRLMPGFDAATALRFVEEIRTLGQMDHPNIVPIYDVGMDDEGRYFFVMKYVEGDTLESVIHHLREGDPEYHRRYPIERRVAIFVDVLRALAAAHAAGLVHRDVKPSNVMVDRRGDVFVMDWGIAKLVAAGDAHEGALVGTPSYMSPEQACGRNGELDPRSDLYSAAALFHELLTLEHYLGNRATPVEMLVAIVAEETSLRQMAERGSPRQPRPPAALLRFVAKGLEKDPDERWKTAEEMIEALQSITEARASVGVRLVSARRRLRGLWLLVAARLQLALYAVLAMASHTRLALAGPTADAEPLPSPGD